MKRIASPPSPADAPSVLIVDDEPEAREMLARRLSPLQWNVALAADGGEALAQMQARPADLVLLDMIMPGMSGAEVFEQLHSLYPDVPVILLTALDEGEWGAEMVRRGAFHYLTKPLKSVQHLLDVAQEAAQEAVQARVTVRVGDLAVDPEKRLATLQGRPVELTPQEYRLLLSLAQRRGQAVGYEQIWREAWACTDPPDKGLIQRTMSHLRQKIGRERIVCLRREGYLLR